MDENITSVEESDVKEWLGHSSVCWTERGGSSVQSACLFKATHKSIMVIVE